jgi:hypothetical protein
MWHTVFEIMKDIFAVVGLLWLLGTLFFALSDNIKNRQAEREELEYRSKYDV